MEQPHTNPLADAMPAVQQSKLREQLKALESTALDSMDTMLMNAKVSLLGDSGVIGNQSTETLVQSVDDGSTLHETPADAMKGNSAVEASNNIAYHGMV